MISFFEPLVSIRKDEELGEFDKVAKRLGLKGFAILGLKYKDSSYSRRKDYAGDMGEGAHGGIEGKQQHSKNNRMLEHVSRLEINETKVGKVRNLLPKIRYQCELLSVQTTAAKVAQWVVKDNRVDILKIPFMEMKGIIDGPLANVAAEYGTFFEIDLSPLIKHKRKNRSFYLRIISRVMSIILHEKAPFILTMNVELPLDFRDRRAVFALAKLIGIPTQRIKESMHAFNERIALNRRKLSPNFIAPGIWLVPKKKEGKEGEEKPIEGETREEIDEEQEKREKKAEKVEEKKEQKESDNEFFEELFPLELPFSFKEISIEKKRMERQRYMLFEILAEEELTIDKKELEATIWKEFTKLFGETGSSRAGLYLTHYNPEKRLGILRCSNQSLEPTRAVLAIISELAKSKVLIHIMKVSGTIRNLAKISKKKSGN